jgi:Rieske Fe-S protein
MSVADARVPRQKVILGAGLGLVAAALAACTTYGKKPEAPGNTATTTVGATPGTGAPGPSATVVLDEFVVTQPSEGVFKGFSSTCTHAGCAVAEVADGTINCPCHGSKFNLDGTVANGPAARPLEARAVSVQGDSIVLD